MSENENNNLKELYESVQQKTTLQKFHDMDRIVDLPIR